MFHSLRGKFLLACLGPLCVLGLAMGAVSISTLVDVTREVQPHVHDVLYQMVTIFIWCFFLAGVIALTLTTRLTRSLTALMAAAKKLADGDLDVKIAIQSDDEVGQFSQTFQDTVRSLKDMIARMDRMTFSDGLTSIHNRIGMDRALETWHKTAGEQPAALVSLDIDDFKFVNDLLGHAAGDEALIALATRLQTFFGTNAVVARQGGDEFMVLLPRTPAAKAQLLLERFTAQPQHYLYNGESHAFTVSMGYVTYPDQARSLRDLTRNADAALYATKLKGKNGFSRYAAEQEQVDRARLSFSLRDISQNLPSGILIYKAADGKILFANDELVHLVGCRTLDEFKEYTNGKFLSLLPLSERTRTMAEIRGQTASTSDHQASVRYHVRRKDGKQSFVHDVSRLKSSPYHGAVYYAVLVKEAEEKK